MADGLAPATAPVRRQAGQLPHAGDARGLVGDRLDGPQRILVAAPLVGAEGRLRLLDQALAVVRGGRRRPRCGSRSATLGRQRRLARDSAAMAVAGRAVLRGGRVRGRRQLCVVALLGALGAADGRFLAGESAHSSGPSSRVQACPRRVRSGGCGLGLSGHVRPGPGRGRPASDLPGAATGHVAPLTSPRGSSACSFLDRPVDFASGWSGGDGSPVGAGGAGGSAVRSGVRGRCRSSPRSSRCRR